jgi:hypothetical protein
MLIEEFFMEQDKISMPKKHVELQPITSTLQPNDNMFGFMSIILLPMGSVIPNVTHATCFAKYVGDTTNFNDENLCVIIDGSSTNTNPTIVTKLSALTLSCHVSHLCFDVNVTLHHISCQPMLSTIIFVSRVT